MPPRTIFAPDWSSSPVSGRIAALVLIALPATALLVWGCERKPAEAPRPKAEPLPVLASVDFAGDAACAGCHEAEARAHRGSRHAITLRPFTRAALGDVAPPAGPVPGTDVALTEKQDHFALTLANEPGDEVRLDLAFGSGKTGMTFVGALDSRTLLEMRKSYFPQRKTWYLTPGHEKKPATDVGMAYDEPKARRCVLCHATAITQDGVMPQRELFGVGCEACHGAGASHVLAMRAGRTDRTGIGRMAKLGAAGAASINALCGKCHRTHEQIAPGTPEAGMTHRFQPYGLSVSRCFKESSGSLSCTTCHDPHTDVSTDARHYEEACLSCHGPTTASGRRRGKPCPVNPRTGCIPCHMPERRVFPSTDLPTSMADHRIAIYRQHP